MEREKIMQLAHAQSIDYRDGYINVRQWAADEEQEAEAEAITQETTYRVVEPVTGWASPSGITYTHVIEIEGGGGYRLAAARVQMLSAAAASRLLGVDRATVGRWFDRGQFPGAYRTPGGQIRIPAADVETIRAAR